MSRFDKSYWEGHWAPVATGRQQHLSVNPYLPAEIMHVPGGTALDVGCGAGTETLWLAQHGWQVTAADISATALETAQTRAADAGLEDRIEWAEVDLARWKPERQWDLVITNYAHASIGQLAFYQRMTSWVAASGTLLIVGHLHGHNDEHRGHEHPDDATATLAEITGLFTGPDWRVGANYENTRTVQTGGRAVQLRDVIVRAHRLT